VILVVVDVDVLEEHVVEIEEPWLHWSVQWESEWLVVVHHLAEHREVEEGSLALFEWIDEHVQFEWHTNDGSPRKVQVVGESVDFLVVGECAVAFDCVHANLDCNLTKNHFIKSSIKLVKKIFLKTCFRARRIFFFETLILTVKEEFVKLNKVVPVVVHVVRFLEVVLVHRWSQENANHTLSLLVALNINVVGEGFVVKTVFLGLDVEAHAILEGVNSDSVVDEVFVGFHEGDKFVNVDVFNIDTWEFEL
ncbi:GSCOCG00000290001-RA-CDS, partial [Cotesia congregata]